MKVLTPSLLLITWHPSLNKFKDAPIDLRGVGRFSPRKNFIFTQANKQDIFPVKVQRKIYFSQYII